MKNRSTLIMTVTATIAGAVSMLANIAQWGLIFGGGRSSNEDERGHPRAGLLGIIVAPIAAMLIQLAISRSREFLAGGHGPPRPGPLVRELTPGSARQRRPRRAEHASLRLRHTS